MSYLPRSLRDPITRSSDESHMISLTRRERNIIVRFLILGLINDYSYCIEQNCKHMQFVNMQEDIIKIVDKMLK